MSPSQTLFRTKNASRYRKTAAGVPEDWESLFTEPSNTYKGKPFWSWNGRLDAAELKRQIGILREMGMGGFFMHSRTGLATEYLGCEWFDLINTCADEAARVNLESWLYDEDRWPSGSAGGKVTADPKFRMRYLRLQILDRAAFTWPEPQSVVAIFAGKVRDLDLLRYRPLPRTTAAPHVRRDEKILLLTWELMPPHMFYNGATYLDTMNPAATRRFIELTHERYKTACGPRLGRSIKGIFTDEPHRGFVMCDRIDQAGPDDSGWVTPWTTALPDEFEKRFGYDLVARLPELFLRLRGARLSQVKWHYMELIQTLFLENWAKPVHAWCRRHQLQLTGHALHEDSLGAQAVPCGSMLRYYEHMDVPGVDVLGLGNRNYWIVKQLVSVARQQGHRWLISELYGCTGWQMDFAGHKEIGDWQAILGINVRCHHLLWYGMAGEAKRDYPASIFFQSAWYREYAALEKYYARLHVALHRGEAVCDLLVIHPVESLWAQIHANWATWLGSRSPDVLPLERAFVDTFQWLTAAQIDFDYGDEDHLARFGSVEIGNETARLRLGRATYKAVVVSGLETIRGTTLALLDRFRAAGGKIIFAGPAPSHVDAKPSRAAQRLAARTQAVPLRRSSLQAASRRAAPPIVRLEQSNASTAQPALLAHVRRDGDISVIALLNPDPSAARRNVIVHFSGPGDHVEEWDARTGERYTQPALRTADGLRWQVDFPVLGEKLFVVSPTKSTLRPPRAIERVVSSEKVSGPFAYELDEPNALVLDQPEWQLGDGAWERATEIIALDEKVRRRLDLPQRAGTMIQPWALPPADSTRRTRLRLRYTIEIRREVPAELTLMLEQPAAWTISCNGQRVSTTGVTGSFIDPCLRTIPLSPKLFRVGSNVIECETLFGPETDLEAIYLLGPFGVFFARGVPVINRLPTTLAVGDAVKQGLPFYSGRIRYRTPLPTTKPPFDARYFDVGAFGGAVVTVEQSPDAGPQVLAWPPHRAELDDDCPTAVVCEVCLTRRNLFGPLHLVPKKQPAIGPEQFRSKGKAFSRAYQLFPSGLLAAPEIVSVVRTPL